MTTGTPAANAATHAFGDPERAVVEAERLEHDNLGAGSERRIRRARIDASLISVDPRLDAARAITCLRSSSIFACAQPALGARRAVGDLPGEYGVAGGLSRRAALSDDSVLRPWLCARHPRWLSVGRLPSWRALQARWLRRPIGPAAKANALATKS